MKKGYKLPSSKDRAEFVRKVINNISEHNEAALNHRTIKEINEIPNKITDDNNVNDSDDYSRNDWKTFKSKVELLMKQMGIKETDYISWIDLSSVDSPSITIESINDDGEKEYNIS